ncbi:unnamed protein product, partial [Scytosiphon promiscuus]
MPPANDRTHGGSRWRVQAAMLLSFAALILLAVPVIASVSRNRSLTTSVSADVKIIRTEYQLQKTVVSSKLRLVVAVGLEGAGHHYVIGAFEQAFTLPVRLNRCSMAKPYVVLHALESSPSNYSTAIQQASSDMSELVLQEQLAPPMGSVATIQGSARGDEGCKNGVGMLSYPNFSRENKVFQYLDLRQLVENAEEKGIDIRVIYLQRSAKDMLFSNIVNRHFEDRNVNLTDSTHEERTASYMRVLYTGAGVMHSMLSEISPRFVVCHDYAKVGDAPQEEQKSRQLRSAHPRASPDVRANAREDGETE